MARLLKKLAKQPKPLLKRLQLDKHPERPLLQRWLSNLPQRRAGERYTFNAELFAFLSKQPKRPLLSGWTPSGKPKIGPYAWVSKPPLAALSSSDKSLLGRMDSHRVPGVVTALLLLGLCLNYLLSLSDSKPKATDNAVLEVTGEDAIEPSLVTAALTPDEELEVSATPRSKEQAATDNKEAMATAAAANLMSSSPAKPDTKTGAKVETKEKTETETTPAAPAVKEGKKEAPPATGIETVELTPEPAAARATPAVKTIVLPAAKPAAKPVPVAKVEPAPAPESAAVLAPQKVQAPNTTAADKVPTVIAAEPAAHTMTNTLAEAEMPNGDPLDSAKPEATAPASAQNVTPEVKPASSTAVAMAEPMSSPGPAPTENPRKLSADRSASILASAKELYLVGNGPLALEKLGLALSAGHVHDDYVERFEKLEADLRSLRALYRTASGAQSHKAAAITRAAFMDAEQAVFPNQSSTYAARLERAAAREIRTIAPSDRGPR